MPSEAARPAFETLISHGRNSWISAKGALCGRLKAKSEVRRCGGAAVRRCGDAPAPERLSSRSWTSNNVILLGFFFFFLPGSFSVTVTQVKCSWQFVTVALGSVTPLIPYNEEVIRAQNGPAAGFRYNSARLCNTYMEFPLSDDNVYICCIYIHIGYLLFLLSLTLSVQDRNTRVRQYS